MADGRDDLPSWLRALYPFKSHFMDGPAGRIHYVDEGKGHPVVLLHGNPSWSFLWRDLIVDLRGSFRCIAPDHLGCGLSDKPRGGPYNLAGHTQRAIQLIDRLGLETFDLVVHDWGGAVGMGIATRMAERIRRIVVTNTAAFPSRRIPWRIAVCRTPFAGPFAVRYLNAFAGPSAFMTTVKPMPTDVRNGFLFPYRSVASRVAINAFVQDIPLSGRHPSFEELNSTASKLPLLKEKPMLIVWGERDFCFTTHFRDEWLRRFPSAHCVSDPDAGHYVLEDSGAEGRNTIVEWLRRGGG